MCVLDGVASNYSGLEMPLRFFRASVCYAEGSTVQK